MIKLLVANLGILLDALISDAIIYIQLRLNQYREKFVTS